MTTNLTDEIRAAALAVHEAEQRGDKTSQLLHGAVLADLVLQSDGEAHLNELADAMWAALEANQRGELSELQLLARRRELWAEADAAGLSRDLGARLRSQSCGRNVAVRP